MNPISPIQQIAVREALLGPQQAANQPGNFKTLLRDSIAQVEDANQTAQQAAEGFIKGENGELHTTILATQRAELQLELFLEVKNKFVQAYQEIMKMQI